MDITFDEQSTLRRERHSAFTLIEMLVVIAIIGILASMLLPSLQSAQQSALSISCLAKMKHISMGFGMYADENYNLIPISYSSTLNRHWHSYIYPVIYPDVKTTDGYWDIVRKSQLFCPADDGKYGTTLTTYAMNAYAGRLNWWGYARNITLNLTHIRNPSKVYLVGEKESGATDGGYYIHKAAITNLFSWIDTDSEKSKRIALRHNNGANFIYFDGSVKSSDSMSVFDLTDEAQGKNITSYYPGMN